MKAQFLGISEFIYMLTNYRVLNITGHYGSGKTLLSVALAMELWKRGYVETIYANFPMAGRDTEYKKNANFAMVLDEAHVVLDARAFSKQASQTWLKDLRKRSSVLMLPAVISVDIRFRMLMCQRILKIGNLYWVYRWQIDDGVGVHSKNFGLLFPGYYFGAYDTKYSPTDDDFVNVQRVMSGEVNTDNGQANQDRYLGVQEVSYPAPENEYYKKVKEPSYPWQ